MATGCESYNAKCVEATNVPKPACTEIPIPLRQLKTGWTIRTAHNLLQLMNNRASLPPIGIYQNAGDCDSATKGDCMCLAAEAWGCTVYKSHTPWPQLGSSLTIVLQQNHFLGCANFKVHLDTTALSECTITVSESLMKAFERDKKKREWTAFQPLQKWLNGFDSSICFHSSYWHIPSIVLCSLL